MAASEKLELVVLDIGMPGMNGLKVAQHQAAECNASRTPGRVAVHLSAAFPATLFRARDLLHFHIGAAY